jgi:hypothetical protein
MQGGMMRIPALLKDLQYVGRAEGDKRSYHIFKGNDGYLVVAPSTRGGLNVNVVDLNIPEIISRKFHGQQVTGPMLAKRSGRPDLFRIPFVPLNSLYVMVALGRARKLNKRDGRAMVFKVR